MRHVLLFILVVLVVISGGFLGSEIESFFDCASLAAGIKKVLAPNTTLFTVAPDFSEKYYSKSLFYWLDYCRLRDIDRIVLSQSSLPSQLSLHTSIGFDSYVKYCRTTLKSHNTIHLLDDYLKTVLSVKGLLHVSYYVGGFGETPALDNSDQQQHRKVTSRISLLLNQSASRLNVQPISTQIFAFSTEQRGIGASLPIARDESFTSKAFLQTSTVVPVVSDISIVAEGSIYIYIFVCSFQLRLAQQYVHGLKWNCDVQETCHMILEYHIHTVHCSNNPADSAATPSVYGALIELEGLLKDNNQDLDYIYFLIGLDALLSFPQPSKTQQNSYIPSVEYGKVTLVQILHPILLSHSRGNGAAFAGQTMTVSRLVLDLKECLRYYNSDSVASYQVCTRELEEHLPNLIAFDEDQRVFHANSSYLDGEALAGTNTNTLNIRQQDVLEPQRVEVFSGLYSFDLFPHEQFLNTSVISIIVEYMERKHATGPLSVETAAIVASTIGKSLEYGEWFSAIYSVWAVVEVMLSKEGCPEEAIDFMALKLATVTRFSSYINYKTSLEEYDACYSILQHMVRHLLPQSSSGVHHAFPSYHNDDAIFSKLIFAAYTAMISVAYECKDIATLKHVYASSQEFLLMTHSNMFESIAELQPAHGSQNVTGVYFVTYATNVTEGLKALLKTAAIAGVQVKIVGMGEKLRYFINRIKAYYQYLQSPHLLPTDVVAFIDAYDVLIFSGVRRLSRIFDEDVIRAPVLVCADGGIYPEKSGSHFYPHGDFGSTDETSFSYVPRYINGGCVVGKVWALRQVFAFLNFYAEPIGDDQLLLARHYQLFPALYHIDSTLIFTLTTHKQYKYSTPSNRKIAPIDVAMVISPDMELLLINSSSGEVKSDIGILHGNNMGSSVIYALANHTYFLFFQAQYQDLNETEKAMVWQSSGDDLQVFNKLAKELRSRKLKDMWSRIDNK